MIMRCTPGMPRATSWPKKVYGNTAGNTTRYDYSGNFLYENSVLKCIFTSEGRIVAFNNNGTLRYNFEYNLKDHLGNTRVVFTAHSDGKPETNQVTSYDPFGFVTKQDNWYATGAFRNKYLYNGKELQDDELAGVRVDWYDYGARMYDPELGRWHVQDRFTEKYISMTPYHYGANNPIAFVDIKGDSIRHTEAFMKNERMWSAFNEWSKADVGKQFIKLFGEGGKFESVSVVFDMMDTKEEYYSKGTTLTELVNKDTNDSKRIEDGDGQTFKNISDIISGKESQFLRFTLAFNHKPRTNDINFAVALNRLTHERQHIGIRLDYLLKYRTMPPNFQYEHDLMNNRLDYFYERYKTFNGFSLYWAKARKSGESFDSFIKKYIHAE